MTIINMADLSATLIPYHCGKLPKLHAFSKHRDPLWAIKMNENAKQRMNR